MRPIGNSLGRVLTVTACLSLAALGATPAQEIPKDMVAFKSVLTGRTAPGGGPQIPLTPPIAPVTVSFTGEAAPLGAVTYISHEIHRFGATGMPQSISDGIAAFTAANGDALFIQHAGLIRPTETPGIFAFEESWTAFGGKGRFVGATGSGVLRAMVDVREMATQGAAWSLTIEGIVSAPRSGQ